jgi:catechol 2,3-dioxygenase-like lactoylglutathione lyase family enzyme
MRFALDHVVIAVRDLAVAADDYRALGFTVVAGGRHPPPRTSSNALITFADGSNPAERWSRLLEAHGEGIIDFALIPEDLPRAVEEAKSRGLALNGPIAGQRLRPDGTLVKWQTARQATFDLPFLCADVTPRGLRVPEGEARVHPNGALGIDRITAAVKEPAQSRERYESLLGREGLVVDGAHIELERTAGREGPSGIAIIGLGRELDARRLHGAAISPAA